uniref:Uncharacterized protein n=1 Tax=Rhizophora mucronata TaxID=61149 RepID=A0A2P2PKD5_RHIMU
MPLYSATKFIVHTRDICLKEPLTIHIFVANCYLDSFEYLSTCDSALFCGKLVTTNVLFGLDLLILFLSLFMARK